MKLKNIIKDKKGAALEMAIIFMVTIFCFCLLVTTMTLTSRSRVKLEKAYLNIDKNLDLIVEDYLFFIDQVSHSDEYVEKDAAGHVLKFKSEIEQLTQENFKSFIETNYGPEKYAKYDLVGSKLEKTEVNEQQWAFTLKLKNASTGKCDIDVCVEVKIYEKASAIPGADPEYIVEKSIKSVCKTPQTFR